MTCEARITWGTTSRCCTKDASTRSGHRLKSRRPATPWCVSSSRGARKVPSFPPRGSRMNRTSRRAAIQVGFAGLLAIVLLFVGIAWVKEYRLGKQKTYLTARFEEVGNLAVGDPVSVRGVRKGMVTKITLEDQGVRVEFEVDKSVVLHPDVEL